MANKQYIEVFGGSKEHLRTDATNKALVELRKKYLKVVNDNPRIKQKMGHFNLMVKNLYRQEGKENEASDMVTTFLKFDEWRTK